MGQSLSDTLSSELLLIATLLAIFRDRPQESRQGSFLSIATEPGSDSVVPGSQILRYALAAAELAEPSTTYASSSVTRYRNGLSPVSSPDAFFPLTRPQMVSTDFPSVFLRMARFIAPNSADAGTSSFAAIVAFALIMTGSDVSAGRLDAGASTFASITAGIDFFAARWGPSRTWAVDGSSVFAADLTLVGAELVLNDAGVGSIGRLAAAPNPFESVHASVLSSGRKG